MHISEFLYRFDGFASFLVNAIICSLATKAYQDTRRRCLLFICIGAALVAVLVLLRAIHASLSSWAAWYFIMFLRILCEAAWLVGFWLLLRDYTALLGEKAPSGASSNGCPAPQLGGSGGSGEPPSVS